MSVIANSCRSWAVRLAGALVLGVLACTISPRIFSAGDKGEALRPELALVPADAFVFVHLRAADVWDNDHTVKLRKWLMEITQKKDALPLDPADIESVSVVVQSGQVLSMLELPADSKKPSKGYSKERYPSKEKFDNYPSKEKFDKFPPKKDDFPPKKFEEKKPDKKDVEKSPKKDDVEKSPENKEKLKEVSFTAPAGDFVAQPKIGADVPDGLLIVTTKKPYDQEKIADLILGKGTKEFKHNDKSYVSNGLGIYLYFASENIFVVASTEAAVKKTIDRKPARAEGPQAAALNLAMKKHQVVLGLNLRDPAWLALKNQLAVGLKKQELDYHHGSMLTAPVWTVIPLLETQSAALAVDLAKESKVQVQASLAYPDAERAVATVGALKDVLVMARVFVIGRLIHQLGFEALEPENRQNVIFMSLLLKKAESALRAATCERRQATVQLRAEGQFDIDQLRDEAKAAAPKLVIDDAARLAAFRKRTVNNLKQLALAMHNYHDSFKGLPSAAIYSNDGKPLLSWRVAILPFVEETALWLKFHMDEPWDSPHNIKLLPRMPKIYAPPPGVKTKEPYSTFYQVLVGKGTAFEVMPDRRRFNLGRDFIDGTSNTIGIVEAGDAVPWSKPADLAYDPKMPLPKIGGTLFPDGFHCSLMDASVRFIHWRGEPAPGKKKDGISEKTLRNAITRDDGQPPGSDW